MLMCHAWLRDCFAITLASYKIESPKIQKIGRQIGKTRKIGETLDKNRPKIESSYVFANFSPILWIPGFFYSVAGQRGRKDC